MRRGVSYNVPGEFSRLTILGAFVSRVGDSIVWEKGLFKNLCLFGSPRHVVGLWGLRVLEVEFRWKVSFFFSHLYFSYVLRYC